MNIKNLMILLVISSPTFLTHTRGLYIYNYSGNTLQYAGTYNGNIPSNGSKSFTTTPTILRIKRTNGIWIPLETYLIGMSFKKKDYQIKRIVVYCQAF